MNFTKLILVLTFLACSFGCAFEENRAVEKQLTSSANNFRAKFNQEKFDQIYSEADEELKNKFTEQQFVNYLKVIKDNNIDNLKETSHVWLEDELKDAIKRIIVKKTKFSNVELASSGETLFREKFEWNLKSGEPKLAAYEIEKICDNPCGIVINAK